MAPVKAACGDPRDGALERSGRLLPIGVLAAIDAELLYRVGNVSHRNWNIEAVAERATCSAMPSRQNGAGGANG